MGGSTAGRGTSTRVMVITNTAAVSQSPTASSTARLNGAEDLKVAGVLLPVMAVIAGVFI